MPSCGTSTTACGSVTPSNQNQNGANSGTNAGNGAGNKPSNGGTPNPSPPSPIIVGSSTINGPTSVNVPTSTPTPKGSSVGVQVSFALILLTVVLATL